MKPIVHSLCLSGLLFSTGLLAAEEQPLPPWLQAFGDQLQQQGDISLSYLKNYLQCFQDQQALLGSPEMSLEEMLQRSLQAGERCAPLVEEMLQALGEQGKEAEAERLRRELLEKSL